ncbi:MAG: hypothetical protein GKS00_24710 [Alphaproteobacteria bacterium]|nr:hypothetical protein [Alphaproteobacteria bacterium]
MVDDYGVGNPLIEVLAAMLGFVTIGFVIMLLNLTPKPLELAKCFDSKLPATVLSSNQKVASAAVSIKENDAFVVHYSGIFVDREMRPVSVVSLTEAPRVVLAVDPALPHGSVLRIRLRIENANVVVVPLDDAWLTRLKAGMRHAN